MKRGGVRRFLLTSAAVLLIGVCCLAVGIYYATGPSLACRLSSERSVQSGTSVRKVDSDGRERCYFLYVPSSYDPTTPMPLLFSLHGFASKPEGQRFISQWEEVADRENFLVVYPQGSSVPLRWYSGHFANSNKIDDVQFIRDMIADLEEIVSVDPTRIYVTGMSNGAMMTERIACELADRVAGVGLVSGMGTNMFDGCNPSRPVPLIGFFGTEDPLIDFENGVFRISLPVRGSHISSVQDALLPIDEWMRGWAKRNGCKMEPQILPPKGDVVGIRYGECKENVEIIIYRIEGGGHAWPGGPEIPFLGKTSNDIHASEVMWEFFHAHPLESTP